MSFVPPPELPITAAIPELVSSLQARHEVVLEAPPGAGKTTCVPLALLSQPWLGDGIIIMLEPRRLAARAAAERMAQMLGEKVGQTVGYRIRLDNCVGPDTKVHVVTEGVLIRLLQDDPSLEGIACVIFDEFHERSLDADLGLALCLQGRELFRESSQPLKLLLMSATLDGQAVSSLLACDEQGAAPIVRSSGRVYPVDIIHCDSALRISDSIYSKCSRVVDVVERALAQTQGSILVFLPGQGEIRCAAKILGERSLGNDVELLPLYGNLKLEQQRRVLQPAKNGVRKLVLATAIAETSLTVDGVTVVIDAGLQRYPQFDPVTGMTRLLTGRVSRASSEQRAGRAGRLSAGSCYRLWPESQQSQLAQQSQPEILQADLAPLVLQLLRWGVSDPAELRWMDLPKSSSYQQALDLLIDLEAVESAGDGNSLTYVLTPHGESMAALALPPRLAHMLVKAFSIGVGALACDLAALLSERDPLAQGSGVDIDLRLRWLRQERGGDEAQRRRLSALSRQYLSQYKALSLPQVAPSRSESVGLLVAFAYPDRIAQRRNIFKVTQHPSSKQPSSNGGVYKLACGRSAELYGDDPLAGLDYLACADVGGGASADRIYLAAPVSQELIEAHFEHAFEVIENVDWDARSERFTAERQVRLGGLVLRRESVDRVCPERRAMVLCRVVRQKGLEVLPWSKMLRQWQARVVLVAEEGNAAGWPDVSDQNLLETLEQWLVPYLDNVRNIDDFSRLDLSAILHALLDWENSQRLDELVPSGLQVPSGSRISIDYCQNPPVLAVRLQEMFGCAETPAVLRGRKPLLVHLLSPAQRPIQVTQDLAGFWQGSYEQVKKEMKGRYPKHFWPDDPMQCAPTRRVKHPKPRR